MLDAPHPPAGTSPPIGWPLDGEKGQAAAPRVPFAPPAGRRWPAGRMRGRLRDTVRMSSPLS
ncbi:hypothetical protein CN172_02330 [Sinorhizobium meliloti]|nr:hypothetical protein EBB04_25505 [Sinorhizobium meliloti]RVE83837.1 hypothetical protein CN240_07825 [Sinorhizobium meliloti]RVG02642.1 hypothetical protein CN232_06345 [Sinorhizobium meliloti]RVG49918.1 hypothetical protein CN227_00455 [Sinorhizobium meliloti]RVH48809.1 hypothetical protein CN208_01050 [Sinorhizobium meliloti]